MVGVTLVEIREHIESLASDGGEYYVLCGRTGDRPVPVADKRFDGRAIAEEAARATERYRAALRRYDPQLPHHDLIVCQAAGSAHLSRSRVRSRPEASGTVSTTTDEGPVSNPERRDLVEFCHRMAAAVFETLSQNGYETLESTVVDTYVDLAESVANPDELCLCLLESMATELDAQLSPTDQAAVLSEAATRLGPTDSGANPLTETLAFLQRRGMIGGYTRSPWSIDLDGESRSAVVELSEYALSPRQGRLPVLPVVLDLYRRWPDSTPASLCAIDVEDGWRVTFGVDPNAEPTGLSSAPIDSEV